MAGGQPGGSNELDALVGPFWSHTDTSHALGTTAEDLAALTEAGGVLGLVTSDGVTVSPVAQFNQQDGHTAVNPALVPVFRALRGIGWATAVLLHTNCSELDDLTPLGWLAQGRPAQAVADLAVVVAREWTAGAA